MKITHLGHSGYLVESEVTVVIDPFLTGNPRAGMSADQIEKADIVLVTHDHPDHLGDALSIAKSTGATLVSVPEIASGDEIEGIGMNFGGTIKVKGVEISMVKAEHSCGNGDVAGFVWKQDGKTLYHMGDTGLFSDIRLIGELYRPDIVFVPIGDHYTMGSDHGAIAVKWLEPKIAIPMHYATFPFLVQSADSFKGQVEGASETKVMVIEPGQSEVL